MALITNIQLDNGIHLDHAYCKINTIHCNQYKLDFILGIYMSKEARLVGGMLPIDLMKFECEHDISDDSCNSIKQAYLYLKSLEPFKNATDDL